MDISYSIFFVIITEERIEKVFIFLGTVSGLPQPITKDSQPWVYDPEIFHNFVFYEKTLGLHSCVPFRFWWQPKA